MKLWNKIKALVRAVYFEPPEKTVLEVRFTEEGVAKLNTLRDKLGLETNKDLLNYALSILEWSADMILEGKTIGSMNQRTGEYTRLVMDIFPYSQVQKSPSDHVKTKSNLFLVHRKKDEPTAPE